MYTKCNKKIKTIKKNRKKNQKIHIIYVITYYISKRGPAVLYMIITI